MRDQDFAGAMISYSQNQEDVVLSRLVSLIPKGFYVDVGAGHPILENVTYDLYLKGWHGINIEPMLREIEMLNELRPRDENVHAAAGSSNGMLTLYEAPLENRGATTSVREYADKYRDAGQSFSTFDVEVLRVDELVRRSGALEVHLLKIDVEGAEREVLIGADLPRMRPWVIVIEATRPNSQELCDDEWISLITSCGYIETLFDGLNKFFVRSDLQDVIPLMSSPANVFDRWKPHEVIQLREEIARQSDAISSCQKSLLDQEHRYEEHIQSINERAASSLLSIEIEMRSSQEYAESLQRHAESLKNRCQRLEWLLYKTSRWTPENSQHKIQSEITHQ